MIDWLLAESTMPNYIALVFVLVGGFGLWAITDSTKRLKESTRNWQESVDMCEAVVAMLEKEDAKDADA